MAVAVSPDLAVADKRAGRPQHGTAATQMGNAECGMSEQVSGEVVSSGLDGRARGLWTQWTPWTQWTKWTQQTPAFAGKGQTFSKHLDQNRSRGTQ